MAVNYKGPFTKEQISFLRKVEIGARKYQKTQSLKVTAPKLAALNAEAKARAAKAAAIEAERKANAKAIRKSTTAKKAADKKLRAKEREEKRKASVIRSLTRKLATGAQTERNRAAKLGAKIRRASKDLAERAKKPVVRQAGKRKGDNRKARGR